MQRIIKFRGLDPERKEWVYGFYYCFGELHFIIEWGKPGIPSQQIQVSPESVGQFTGLHDRIGTPIFEGDILKDNLDGYVVIREMTDGHFTWKSTISGIGGIFPFDYNQIKNCEIIGNIYQDSHLMDSGV